MIAFLIFLLSTVSWFSYSVGMPSSPDAGQMKAPIFGNLEGNLKHRARRFSTMADHLNLMNAMDQRLHGCSSVTVDCGWELDRLLKYHNSVHDPANTLFVCDAITRQGVSIKHCDRGCVESKVSYCKNDQPDDPTIRKSVQDQIQKGGWGCKIGYTYCVSELVNKFGYSNQMTEADWQNYIASCPGGTTGRIKVHGHCTSGCVANDYGNSHCRNEGPNEPNAKLILDSESRESNRQLALITARNLRQEALLKAQAAREEHWHRMQEDWAMRMSTAFQNR